MSDILDDEFDSFLMHYGVLHRSGRYPWGSGKNPEQRNRSFLSYIDELKKQGMSEVEIARAFSTEEHPFSTTDLRALKSRVKDEIKSQEISLAWKLKEKGYSNVAIGKRMGINESSVRSLLAPGAKEKRDLSVTVANQLKEKISTGIYLDVGEGTEHTIGISKPRLGTAIAMLKDEGYQVKYVKVKQLGTKNFTSVKILVPPGLTNKEIYTDTKLMEKIKPIDLRTDDGGRTFYGLREPTIVNSKRISINYLEDGGALKDGIIELRPGVEDLNLGNARYAQVRIAVDGTHYLKGMAVYANDLPDGIDIRFNSNKSNTTSKMDTMKPVKDDPDNPFGAAIKVGGQRGALNILNEEGDWYEWSKSLSSQMLSKQNPSLIKKQLGLTFDAKRAEFDEIVRLTNPTVRQKLLESFADDVDSSSVKLKAMGLPGTASHVILPVPSMKDTEIYAPQYKDGDRVVLIRHPHGGIFEIPELIVNNKNKAAQSVMGRAKDAVGIHPKVAEQLSGADFDGDTVLVIPNNSRAVKHMAALDSLKNFDPKTAYPGYPGMKVMSNTGLEMGKASNLITDMTIKGASVDEIVRAVRHSMVVIDAEKKGLNWKQSEKDHGISELKAKYQGSPQGGAATIISVAKRELKVPERKARPAALGGPIDPNTGEKVYINTGVSYVNKKGETIFKTTSSTVMGEAKDAFSLSSGTPREALYAEHANKLKALANTARKEAVNTKSIEYSPTAKVTYSKEVNSLIAKLNIAKKNAPLERQAQLIANTIVKAKHQANPQMDGETRKKIEGQALREARERTGAKKQQIVITDREWEAIQAGAISKSRLSDILNNTDLDVVKKLATPRTSKVMVPAKVARARAMIDAGYTQAEVAEALGISKSTLNDALN